MVVAGTNIEIKARLLRHDEKYLYMESKTDTYRIIKKELTKEGVRQILKNKEKELTIFIPPKSIKAQTPRSTVGGD